MIPKMDLQQYTQTKRKENTHLKPSVITSKVKLLNKFGTLYDIKNKFEIDIRGKKTMARKSEETDSFMFVAYTLLIIFLPCSITFCLRLLNA